MMRVIRPLLLCSCLMLVSTWCFSQSQDSQRKLELLNAYPDSIIVNAKIITMSERNSQAEAMAIKNSRISAIGTNNEIRFLAGPQTTVMDMKGRNVLPGLIDPHQHAHLWLINHWFGAENFAAKKFNDPQLQLFYAKGQDRASVQKELERIVHERATVLGPGKWIWVGLFAGNGLTESRRVVWPMIQNGPEQVMTKQYLDNLAPNNPLIVMSTECCLGTHNTKAAEQMQKILGHETDSRTEITYELLLRGKTEEKAQLVKQELTQSIASLGVTTTASNYWGSPSIMKSYNLLYQRGELPVRWAWYFDTPRGDDAIPFFANLGDFRGIGNDYIWNAGVSDEGWESGLECTTSKPLKPITSHEVDGPHVVERPCSDPIDYEKIKGYRDVRAGLEDGLRITFLHTYSEGGYQALFNLLNQEIDQRKITLEEVRGLLLGAEHNPLLRPDFIPSIVKFNIVPSLTAHTMQGETRGGLYLQEFGLQEHLSWLMPVKSLVDAGVHPVLATDSNLGAVPVYAQDMDYPREWNGNLWAFLEFFVTRTMPNTGVVYNKDQAVDKMTMLKLTTIWAAQSILNDKNIGSLEAGKLADFIVIDKDFATVPDNQVHSIKTLLTVMGGKVTYKSPNY